MAPHSSTLAWKIPWTEEPGRLSPWGRTESDTTEQLHFHFHALEKGMATHSSVLAWRIPGTGEPGGLPSVGLHRVGHDWNNLPAEKANGWLSIENSVGCYWWFNKITVSKFLFSPLYQLIMDSAATTETFKQEMIYAYKHKLQCGQTRAGDNSMMPCGIQDISAFPLSHP